MTLNNLLFAHTQGVVKINVHGVVDDVMHPNGNLNIIGIIARDHMRNFLWGIMGPLKKMECLLSQIWAIHLEMKAAV